jgi:hypothetical protein
MPRKIEKLKIKELESLQDLPSKPKPIPQGKYEITSQQLKTLVERGLGRRRRLPPGECPSCDRDGKVGPSHDPSPYCESGSRPHCTCDLCF